MDKVMGSKTCSDYTTQLNCISVIATDSELTPSSVYSCKPEIGLGPYGMGLLPYHQTDN